MDPFTTTPMSTLERIRTALAGLVFSEESPRDCLTTLRVEAPRVKALLSALRDRAGFDTTTFVTAVDRFPSEPRYDVAWQLMSIEHNDRVRVHALVAGPEPRVASIVDLYPGAAYFERECFDMFGIVFEGHAGLKRLLMPEGYDHFPLRKDFPHQGIEPDRLYRDWDRRRREIYDAPKDS